MTEPTPPTIEKRLAKDAVPDPLEGLVTDPPAGIAAELAAYHAARAQGFYLATMEEPGSIREFVSPLLYEATLAGIYFDLATTDEVEGDVIAFNNAAAMRNAEGIGPLIFRLLDWANVVPESIKAYSTKQRTITTVEELEALPIGSVIADRDGDAWQRYSTGWTCTDRAMNTVDQPSASLVNILGPAVVLREGPAA